MIKVIVFDFDGVLVNSNYLKDWGAWFSVFPESGEVPRDLFIRVKEKVKETRYDILRALARELHVSEEREETWVQKYAEEYNRYVQSGIGTVGLVPGMEKLLKELSEHHPLYLNSATPEHALRETCDQMGIASFFTGILGAPASKEENLESILAAEGMQKDELLFLGDGMSDWYAAQAIGCFFIGVANETNRWESKNVPFPLVKHPAMIYDVMNTITK